MAAITQAQMLAGLQQAIIDLSGLLFSPGSGQAPAMAAYQDALNSVDLLDGFITAHPTLTDTLSG